jgi:hypothetical protein
MMPDYLRKLANDILHADNEAEMHRLVAACANVCRHCAA